MSVMVRGGHDCDLDSFKISMKILIKKLKRTFVFAI